MSLLIATPVVLPPRADVLKSWDHRPHMAFLNGATDEWRAVTDDNDLIYGIHGTGHNIGVAGAWNFAFLTAQSQAIEADYVALLSQNCVLHEGTAHLARMVDEYADERGLLTDLAWHCIVLSVQLWEQLGPVDEAFGKAYYEDSDYCRRMFLAGAHTPTDRMPKVELDATCEQAASMKAGIVTPADYERNGVLYERIWGGPPFHERFTVKGDPMSVNEDLNWATHEALA